MSYETVAAIAQTIKPEQLFVNAAAYIAAILSGAFEPNSVTVDMSASLQPAAVPAPEAPEPEVTITRLGTNPVVSDADLTPAEKEAIEKGKFSKVEKGFQDTTDNDINDSPIEKSARAAAMKFFNGDVEEVERYMTWLHENKQYFIDGSKTPIVDGVGYNKDGFKDVEIVNGDAVMGERNGGAKEVKLVFDKPEQATRGVYVTSGGESVNSDVYDTCGNPQLSNVPDPEKPAPAPAPEAKADVCVDPSSVPVEQWKAGVLPSKEGVIIHGVPYPEVQVIYAPEGMTEEEALAKLRAWAEANDPKGLRGGYLLYTDSNCDGNYHPDRIQCVSFSADNNGQVTMKDTAFNGNPGNQVGPSRGDTDYDRMSRRTQEKVLAN